MVNANYSNGVLTFENSCPTTSPAASRVGDVLTIRTPGTVAGCYSDFEVISRDGDDFLALEVGSKTHAAWIAGAWSAPVGR